MWQSSVTRIQLWSFLCGLCERENIELKLHFSSSAGKKQVVRIWLIRFVGECGSIMLSAIKSLHFLWKPAIMGLLQTLSTIHAEQWLHRGGPLWKKSVSKYNKISTSRVSTGNLQISLFLVTHYYSSICINFWQNNTVALHWTKAWTLTWDIHCTKQRNKTTGLTKEVHNYNCIKTCNTISHLWLKVKCHNSCHFGHFLFVNYRAVFLYYTLDS